MEIQLSSSWSTSRLLICPVSYCCYVLQLITISFLLVGVIRLVTATLASHAETHTIGFCICINKWFPYEKNQLKRLCRWSQYLDANMQQYNFWTFTVNSLSTSTWSPNRAMLKAPNALQGFHSITFLQQHLFWQLPVIKLILEKGHHQHFHSPGLISNVYIQSASDSKTAS